MNFPESSICEKIQKLKPDSAFGPDKNGPRILQAAPLAIVFRKSLEEDIVPDDWKKAMLLPYSNQVLR